MCCSCLCAVVVCVLWTRWSYLQKVDDIILHRPLNVSRVKPPALQLQSTTLTFLYRANITYFSWWNVTTKQDKNLYDARLQVIQQDEAQLQGHFTHSHIARFHLPTCHLSKLATAKIFENIIPMMWVKCPHLSCMDGMAINNLPVGLHRLGLMDTATYKKSGVTS